MRSSLAFIVASALLAAPAGAVTVTGTDFATKYGGPAAVQTTPTGFGNNQSELDAFYAGGDTSRLCFGIAGNLEDNTGNAIVLLLDTKPGGDQVFGQNTPVAGSFKITNRYGSLTFDDGFLPDFAISVDTWAGQAYANFVDLQSGANSYIGSAPINGAATASGDFEFVLNNTNVAGVSGPGETQADPALVTSGLEMCINGGFLGLDPSLAEYKALAYLVGGDGKYLSSQFLPGIPAGPEGAGNWGNGAVDLRQVPGNQYVALRAVGAPIPEPGTLALLGIGGLPFLRRRK